MSYVGFMWLNMLVAFRFGFRPAIAFLVAAAAASTLVCTWIVSVAVMPRNAPAFCDYTVGSWVLDPSRRPHYADDCPFHRNAWNCGRNRRPGMDKIFAWRWVPSQCDLPVVDPGSFLGAMRNMRIGFVGDSLNENFVVAMLCILQAADPGARKWKRKGAWRGGYFPRFNVTVGYHRAVLLAQYYELQPSSFSGPLEPLGLKKAYRVDIDVPARDWANVLDFYDVFIFNTGHWWNLDKFPRDSPLLFYNGGELVLPLMGMKEGLSAVLEHMIAHIERGIPSRALKLWRMQSPRHFEGGDWNQNGSCISNSLLSDREVEDWFTPEHGGVNVEAREMNRIIKHALHGKSFHLLDVSHLSEYRRDAHPAIWLGRKDAHLVWGEDCMHWCLPGLPDTWVDILAQMILKFFD